MTPTTSSAFALPDRLVAKTDPTLIGADERFFAALAQSLRDTVDDLVARLDTARRTSARSGEAALERDQTVHRLTARLRTLRRFGLDLCLGRMVGTADTNPVYVGRLGLTDPSGHRLLVDWRSPAAEPFFAATHAEPMGLTSRRRYRWSAGRITDYWDEVFVTGALAGAAALDDESAFLASLGGTRSARMRDVLATIAADQNAIIRADSGTALVVDGGPGTGKTVVALHRAAYLLHADPRLGPHRGGVLFVGPHQAYLDYVADVLPGLGEDGVQVCTLRDLVAEGTDAGVEADPAVARLKADVRMVDAVEAAVRFYEEPPVDATTIGTEWADMQVTPTDWAEAFAGPAPGTPHNEAREQILDELVEGLAGRVDHDADDDEAMRRDVRRNRELRAALGRAWPLLHPTDLVGDLWSVPAFLRRCAPWLDRDGIRVLQRADPHAWTTADLPLLDAARARLGDPDAEARQRRRDAELAREGQVMSRVVDDLIAADDSELLVMTMLRGADLRGALVDEDSAPRRDPDRFAGPFAHVIVDEAQELTDAEWRMVLQRCPSRSLTVVGDRAQARHGFPEPWRDRLSRVGLGRAELATLRINYRTPAEVMAAAEPVIRAAVPDANVPTSVRSTGVPVAYAATGERDAIVESWLADSADGIACVIGDPAYEPMSPRVRSLSPELAKGLEFDLVVLVDPAALGGGVEGAVDRYVAMTRSTDRLVVLEPRPSALR